MTKLAISTPGRICLFGEHQDYLLLPVIPCAISLRLRLEGERRSDNTVRLALPDIGKEVSFTIDHPLQYTGDRDYLRSVVNVLQSAIASAEKPPKTTQWTAPMRAQASIAIGSSGIIGM